MTAPIRLDALRPGGRALRAVRSTGAALVCVTTAAIGHRAAGGTLPAELVLAALAGSAAVAWALSSRRIAATQLVGLLVLCQVCVHLAAAPSDMTMGAAMITTHVAATAVSAGVLARGEWFVWQLAERLALRLVPLLRAVGAVRSSRPAPAVVVERSRLDVRLAHSRRLRGPPAGLA